MDEQVVIGLFTLGGTIIGGMIGGLFSVKAAKVGFKKVNMEKDIRDLANQVKSYWYLEKEYLSQISELNNTPEKTVMEKTRSIVEKNGNKYPNMTAKEADDILKNYE